MEKTFRVLDRMVRDGVIGRYAVAGAVGALNYLEAMTTYDLDILISVENMTSARSGLVSLEPVYAYLREAGYGKFEEEGVVIEGWPV